MRYPPNFLDEIRARLSVSTVVGRKVALKRAGREYKGLSPFKMEKTPSFTVNDQKGFYHCFASGKHGNIFDFIMETEGLGFVEAVEAAASQAGMPIPAASPDAARHEQRRKTLYDVMDLAAKFFADTLTSRGGAKARGYLADRSISPQTQLQFRLGYAPDDWDDTVNWARSKGYEFSLMEKAGLILKKDGADKFYGRFRGRLMFPICDEQGRVIGFSGRILTPDEKTAKYVNSPETPIFTKSKVFFGLDKTRRSLLDYLKKQNRVVPLSEMSDHFAFSQLHPKHLEAACEWLERKRLLEKVSAPFKLTRRSLERVEEPAYFLNV